MRRRLERVNDVLHNFDLDGWLGGLRWCLRFGTVGRLANTTARGRWRRRRWWIELPRFQSDGHIWRRWRWGDFIIDHRFPNDLRNGWGRRHRNR